MSHVTLLTPPAVEPLDLTETKAHLRVEHDREDTAIQALIRAARELCEQVTRRALIEQTRALRLDRLPSLFKMHRMIPLPYPPLIAVEQVTQRSASGVETILPPADYEAVAGGEGSGRLSFKRLPWEAAGLTIRYRCGYGPAPDDVPAPLRHGMLMLLAHWYEQRESAASNGVAPVPYGVEALWRPFKVVSL
jgi:uncharacterized phiE125 gp8 family phage protein